MANLPTNGQRFPNAREPIVSVLYIALPIALLLGGGGMLACIICIRAGQYDDLDTPAVRMLIDEDSGLQRDPSSSQET